ncbi:MAG: PglZ domain-containing protein [Chloroflexota bacterium]
MGPVSECLREMVARQVDENGIVVWYDPGGFWRELAASLDFPNTQVALYNGSFFAVRREVDPLLSGENKPRLVVYVDMDEADTDHALIELMVSGVTMKPGHPSKTRNTRPRYVAQRAFSGKLSDESLEETLKQVDAGKLSLRELDEREESDSSAASVVITTIFGTGNPAEVALRFLSEPRLDAKIAGKDALGDIADLLGKKYNLPMPTSDGCAALREALARHLLSTEFTNSLEGELPVGLSLVKVAEDEPARSACIELARIWRLRRDVSDSYAMSAERAEKELGLTAIEFEGDALGNSETFPVLEGAVQHWVEERLTATDKWPDDTQTAHMEFITRRLSGFWPERYPSVKARWQIIQTAAHVLFAAQAVEAGLKALGVGSPVEKLLDLYTGKGASNATQDLAPWCLLDTYHRRLMQLYYNFDAATGARYEMLERLVVRAQQRYSSVGDVLANRFVKALQSSKFKFPGYSKQSEVYSRYVAPALKDGLKTAYVLVDALRYEMARDLLQESFKEGYKSSISAVLGTPPTITPVGMAALMPGAEKGVTLMEGSKKELGLRVSGTFLGNRQARVQWLKETAGAYAVEATLDDVLPKPKSDLKREIDKARLVFVTSQEIDMVGESGSDSLARMVMERISEKLVMLVNKLRELGCQRIVITADHGFLYGDQLTSDMKIELPGGTTASAHRRVWVGRGGADSPSYMRTGLSALGLSDELEIAVPWGFGAFLVPGGALSYFHGGMSPQEMVIPVIELLPEGAGASAAPEVSLSMEMRAKKISTRFLAISVVGSATNMLEQVAPRVRVDVKMSGNVVSQPVTATYGYTEATGDVQLQFKEDEAFAIDPDTITLMLTVEEGRGQASIHLTDAVTGREYHSMSGVEVNIAV